MFSSICNIENRISVIDKQIGSLKTTVALRQSEAVLVLNQLYL